LRVFFDDKELASGLNFQEDFVDKLARSRVFMPIVSHASVGGWGKLVEASPLDKVYLEHRVALALSGCSRPLGTPATPAPTRDAVALSALVQRSVPVFVGKADQQGVRSNFFSPDRPAPVADVEVKAVEAKLDELFVKLKLQNPAPARAKEVCEWTYGCNGACFWDGDGGSTDIQVVCTKIVQAVRQAEVVGWVLAPRSRGGAAAAAAPDACTCPVGPLRGAL
jgi:hypothetical protein